jgi:hypothetical protein
MTTKRLFKSLLQVCASLISDSDRRPQTANDQIRTGTREHPIKPKFEDHAWHYMVIFGAGVGFGAGAVALMWPQGQVSNRGDASDPSKPK